MFQPWKAVSHPDWSKISETHTLEIAPLSVGFGADDLAPNNLFISAICNVPLLLRNDEARVASLLLNG